MPGVDALRVGVDGAGRPLDGERGGSSSKGGMQWERCKRDIEDSESDSESAETRRRPGSGWDPSQKFRSSAGGAAGRVSARSRITSHHSNPE